MRYYLGTNFGHGSAAALVNARGMLLSAVEEGRVVNRKDCSEFPVNAIQFVLDNVDLGSVEWLEGWRPLERLFFKGIFTTAKYGWRDGSYVHERLLRELLRIVVEVRCRRRQLYLARAGSYLGHHEAHAYSLLPWGLPTDSIVIVSDYTGERWSVSAFHWGSRGLRVISRSPFPHSLGAAYHQLASHLGFNGHTGPGKLMALSAYGVPRWEKLLLALTQINERGIIIDQKRFPLWNRRRAWSCLAASVGGEFANAVRAAHHRHENGFDLAASVQSFFEKATLNLVKRTVSYATKELGLKVNAVGLSGGCALNCQANGLFARELPLTLEIPPPVISPWSDDCGTAIGAAVFGAVLNDPAVTVTLGTPFLGPNAGCAGFPQLRDRNKAYHALLHGQVIALSIGRLEFGPRALGGRCLLADPRVFQIRRFMNRIKGRPSFMPFAPVVLEEDFKKFFVGVGSSNMVWTVPIQPEVRHRYPGLDHASGEARVQIVESRRSFLAEFLIGWKRISGSSLLLLTSLNGPNEAIPATLEESQRVARRLRVAGLLHGGGWEPIQSYADFDN